MNERRRSGAVSQDRAPRSPRSHAEARAAARDRPPNDYPLPVTTVEELRGLYQFRDFDHFIDVWILVTNALRREADFRQLVVDYAGEAARHGAVYIEGIFSPIERTWRGVHWDEIL